MKRTGFFGPAFLIILAFWLTAAGELAAEKRPKAVMLGDSLTAGADWAAHLPEAEAVNQGVSGDGVDQIAGRLDQVIAAKPDLIFLQAGINDLGRQEMESLILDRHHLIWARLRAGLPGARLHLISLFPVSEGRYAHLNMKIRKMNQLLKASAERQGLTFIDLHPLLADGDGWLRPEFTYDGLHLTPAGYEVWLKALKPYFRGAGHD